MLLLTFLFLDHKRGLSEYFIITDYATIYATIKYTQLHPFYDPQNNISLIPT